MRAFVAIVLDAILCDALNGAMRAMRAANPPVKVKWVRPEHQHLTLHFFGEVDARRVDDINGALQRAAAGAAPFEIEPADLGCFPNIYKPNVLWVGIHEPSHALAGLHRKIEVELAALGFEREARAFTPHLTLARVPHNAASAERKALGDWFVRQKPPERVTQRVGEIKLMRSDLLPEGHRYTEVGCAALTPLLAQ